jgi:multidrug efflux pump subunit AcrA (membrane-fusion protein)
MKKSVVFIVCLSFFLAGCRGVIGATPTPAAAINLDAAPPATDQSSSNALASGGVSASGVVKADQEAKIGSLSTSRVLSVAVKLGDTVSEGQVLATLSGTEQRQADLSAAEKQLIEWKNQLKDFQDQAVIASTQAEKDVFTAQDELQDAKDRLTNLRYQRWLYQTKTKDQIKAREKDLDAKFTNPTQANLDEAVVDVALAEARLKDAQVVMESLKAGADPDRLAFLEAAVQNAEDQVDSVKAALDNLTLKAPFAGQISGVNVSIGDVVSPGQVLFILTDPSNLHVETTDLSERDVPSVRQGQAVTVNIKPLNEDVPGTVVAVAARAETIGGDTVYTTLIALESVPTGTLPGMSVDVDFEP